MFQISTMVPEETARRLETDPGESLLDTVRKMMAGSSADAADLVDRLRTSYTLKSCYDVSYGKPNLRSSYFMAVHPNDKPRLHSIEYNIRPAGNDDSYWSINRPIAPAEVLVARAVARAAAISALRRAIVRASEARERCRTPDFSGIQSAESLFGPLWDLKHWIASAKRHAEARAASAAARAF